MNWTVTQEPNAEIPYNHVKVDTPLGTYDINWKGWKENPSYDINLNGTYVGTEYDLESAKDHVRNVLLEMANQLNGFIKEMTS